MRIVKQSVSLEYVTPLPAEHVEQAGRTCYKSEDKITTDSAIAFVKMIMSRGHESVIEHPYASFRVICDRGVSHEFVRHRLMSYSQESTRYCNYGKGKFGGEITVIQPPDLTKEELEQWMGAMEHAEARYMTMLDLGSKPQIARSVLPNSLKTELVATANFREWRHFLKLRTSPAAHPQMREVAGAIGEILLEHCPVMFEDIMRPGPDPKLRKALMVKSLKLAVEELARGEDPVRRLLEVISSLENE